MYFFKESIRKHILVTFILSFSATIFSLGSWDRNFIFNVCILVVDFNTSCFSTSYLRTSKFRNISNTFSSKPCRLQTSGLILWGRTIRIIKAADLQVLEDAKSKVPPDEGFNDEFQVIHILYL